VYISELVKEGGWEIVYRHDLSDPGVTLVLSQQPSDGS
jgi:hypothetical protein